MKMINQVFKDIRKNEIADIIKDKMIEKGLRSPFESEFRSWTNSLNQMRNILETNEISNDSYIAIEYKLANSKKRIDFLICGKDENGLNNVVIIELKQWEIANLCDKNDYVKTFTGNKLREVQHPSYQVKSYKYLLETFNKSIVDKNIKCNGLAYLHNASKNKNIDMINSVLFSYISEFPIFFKEDYDKLQKTLIKLIGKGNGKEILYYIENGKLKPSKKLIDVVGSTLKDNNEFMLVDTQKLVYENVMSKVNERNNVFIINGNPGTGKSVVAINLLNSILKSKKIVQFVSPNSAFKSAIQNSLKKYSKAKKLEIEWTNVVFQDSKGYVDLQENSIDWIIVDEAHRLKNKEKQNFAYKGVNQIEDIIKVAKNVIFFIDENQIIRSNDIGTNENVMNIAKKYNKNIFFGKDYHLETQFRCVGAQGYVNALDTLLQIQETGNFYLNEDDSYEIKICDSPQEMEELLNEKIKLGFKNSKILAGYAWKHKSKNIKNEEELNLKENHDIKIIEHNWSIPWNKIDSNNLWAENSKGKRQAGSVHMVQGLEFDYCGVIIGNDISINKHNEVFAIYENNKDFAGKVNFRGKGTKSLKEDKQFFTRLIKNIYKILLTRGQKGTFIYICDDKLREYFKKYIK